LKELQKKILHKLLLLISKEIDAYNERSIYISTKIIE